MTAGQIARLTGVAFVISLLTMSVPVMAQAFLPEDNLAYPVQVTMTGGGGSGFFVRRDRTLFFVTAGHVLFEQQRWEPHAGEATLRALRKLAPGRSVAMEIGVLTQLVARNVDPAQASKMVLDLMARKATGTQLTALSSAVQEDVEAGLAPAMALDLRGRGIMSLLPPPSAVSTLNPRSTPRP